MKQARIGRASWWIAGALALAGVAVAVLAPEGSAAEPAQAKVNKYIGAAKCKNCHASDETGNQHAAWSKMEHAKAFEALASEEARKFAAERGIADAQKDEKCLKCHTTGFGAPPEAFDKKFDLKLGVQCETCHGPGEAHMKARMAAAMSEDPAKKLLGEGAKVEYIQNYYDALEGADALVLCTEWKFFRNIDLDRAKTLLKAPVVFDGRNVYNPRNMMGAGFDYFSVGREPVLAHSATLAQPEAPAPVA